ncbi:uncharacterized protein LOC141618716 [Silene latifolia]|uniref:uncharacterized protein LOC141618716 n=1 Tax=Silene latifolia TaxID=37657 RepID=UPI003D78A5A3
MRFTKQKRHRKIVRFYTACFGFREPFKVLCDGTFIHHLSNNNLVPDKSVSSALAAPVHLFTTKCAIAELESLGRSYGGSVNSARRDFRLAKCEHDQNVSAYDCIVETVGDNNPEHFFVASQDVKLRKQCQKVPGVPVMYGLRNAVYLDQLSSFQREYVKVSEEERLRMTDSEYKLLQKRVKKISNSEIDSSEEENEDEISEPRALDNRKTYKRGLEIKDKAKFKLKRAKAPNPLSRKKKSKPSTPASNSGKKENAGSGATRSRPRKRKRSHKAQTSSATPAS